jgi:hypothetical protein
LFILKGGLVSRKSIVQQIYHNTFNIKFALISAVCNGLIVMLMHRQFGWSAFEYGGAQAISSFLSTGVTARLVQHFSPIRNPVRSYVLGSFIPAFLTGIMSVSAHAMNHTPDVFFSSFPSILISFVTSFVTNAITRHGYFRPPNYPSSGVA